MTTINITIQSATITICGEEVATQPASGSLAEVLKELESASQRSGAEGAEGVNAVPEPDPNADPNADANADTSSSRVEAYSFGLKAADFRRTRRSSTGFELREAALSSVSWDPDEDEFEAGELRHFGYPAPIVGYLNYYVKSGKFGRTLHETCEKAQHYATAGAEVIQLAVRGEVDLRAVVE